MKKNHKKMKILMFRNKNFQFSRQPPKVKKVHA